MMTKQAEYSTLRGTLPILGLLGLIGLTAAPQMASANSANSFLETIGISAAVGTVLGASTLPFYDQPGTHLKNLAYGASAGALVGVGVAIYEWIEGPSSDQYGETESLAPRKFTQAKRSYSSSRESVTVAPAPVYSAPPTVWMPLVSLTW